MLKYLFEAEFTTGHIIKQTQEDKSELDEKRNQFYDVLNCGLVLRQITYIEQKLWNPNKVIIDYTNGMFRFNDVEMYPEPIFDDKNNPTKVEIFIPIRYMIVQKHTLANFDPKSGIYSEYKDQPEDRIFYIGWQANVGDKSYKRIVGIK